MVGRQTLESTKNYIIPMWISTSQSLRPYFTLRSVICKFHPKTASITRYKRFRSHLTIHLNLIKMEFNTNSIPQSYITRSWWCKEFLNYEKVCWLAPVFGNQPYIFKKFHRWLRFILFYIKSQTCTNF